MKRMAAIQYDGFGGPDVLRMRHIAIPSPGPGQVLIRVKAASVVPADWKLRAGHLTRLFQVTFPKTPGRDGAGIVAATGNKPNGVL